jgi:transcriptional regulator with XRE-family HTH domain
MLGLGHGQWDSTEIDRQVGWQQAQARKAAGVTKRQLAAQFGLLYSTLANYEEGRRPLRVAQLSTIAAALDQSPVVFLVNLPEAAAVINRIDGDLERCLQIALILDSLDSTPPKQS